MTNGVEQGVEIVCHVSVVYTQDEMGASNKGSGGVETITVLKQE